jgi:serine/threonine protein kinase
MTTSRFCDVCGGALPANAAACPFCGETVTAISSAPTPSPAPPRSLRPIVSTPTPAPVATPGPGSLLAGRYLILEKIGEGGFGAVYKARDRRLWNEVVAVKQINMAALSAQEKIEATDSYNREITLLSVLKHRNGLPRVRNYFTDPEHWYVVMDYIPGRTLEEILATTLGGRLSVAQAVEIGSKLCDVLGYLHEQNPPIIFRDVKPGNIMLTAWGQVYLIDFGIARRWQAGKPGDTTPLGSPGYAALEQYGKRQSTEQTDIYGLGATLQTLLTGCEPLEIRMHGMPPDCKIPFKLQALITNMLDPTPRKRPESVREVKNVLDHLFKRFDSLNKPQRNFGFFSLTWALFSSIVSTHSFTSHIWLIYLLITLGIIVARNIYVLLHLRMLAFPVPTIGGILKLIGQRALDTLYFAFGLALFFQGIYILLHLNFQLYTVLFLVCWLLCLFYFLAELRRFWRWWQGLREVRQRTRQQQATPLQQQMQKRP